MSPTTSIPPTPSSLLTRRGARTLGSIAIAIAIAGCGGGGSGGGGTNSGGTIGKGNPPTLVSVQPARGPVAGGTPVTLLGSGFLAGASPSSTTVTFGGTPATTVTIVDDARLTAVTPAATSSGPVDVTVTTPNGSATLPGSFLYLAPVTVTWVSPPTGPLPGGTQVRIDGFGFLQGSGPSTTHVTFGGVEATQVQVVDDQTILAVTPPQAGKGAVDVIVTNAIGTATFQAGFLYALQLPLAGVQPLLGPMSGGTPVTITGSGFLDGVTPGSTTVQFGAVPATQVTVIDDTTLTATSPAMPAASIVDVMVINSAGAAAIQDGFAFYGPILVAGVLPPSGPLAGGYLATIQGSGFATGVVPGSTAVGFGSKLATDVAVVSDDTLTVTVPAGTAPGAVAVTVANSSGSFSLDDAFLFTNAVGVASVTPSSGPLGGGTAITITGSGFQSGVTPGSTSVQVGGVPATQVVVTSDTVLTATTGPSATPGAADVVVTNSQGTGILPGGFTYVFSLGLTAVQPPSGPLQGGTAVTLSGSGFLLGVTPGSTAITFDGSPAANVAVLSDTAISCVTPQGSTTGAADVTVTNSTGTVTLAGGFTYTPNPPAPNGQTLTVVNPDSFDRFFDPVTVGIPFPEAGSPTDTTSFRLIDAATGIEIPAQWTILTRWNGLVTDSSLPIRVALADFQAPFVPAQGTAQVILDTTTPSQPFPSPLTVSDTGSEVLVNTGPLEVTIDKSRFNLFRKVRIDTDGDGTPDHTVIDSAPGTFFEDNGVVITRTDGTTYESALGDTNVSVTIEDAGPLHAVVCVTSRHESKTDLGINLTNGANRVQFDWLEQKTRYHFYAGKPWVKVVYALRYTDRRKQGEYNQGGSWIVHRFEDLSFRLKPTAWNGPTRVTLAAESPDWEDWFDDKPNHPLVGQGTVTRTLTASSDSLGLYQDSSGVYNWGDNADGKWGTSFRGYRVDESGALIDQGLQALGAIRLEDNDTSITAGIRWFWQQFPSALRAWGGGGLLVSPFPGAFKIDHEIKGGRQRMFETYYAFESPGSAPDLQQFALARNRPLEARVDPLYAQQTEAFGLFSIEDPANDPTYFGRYEQIATFFVDGPKHPYNTPPENPDTDKFGYDFRMDMFGFGFGDAWRGGDKNTPYYGNNELDVPWGCFNQWQRKAVPDYRFFQLGEISARDYFNHTIYHTNQDNPAYNWVTHTNDQSGQKYKTALPNYSHCWIEGVLRYWWLSGNRYALESALELGQGIQTNIDPQGDLAYSNETRAQAWTGRNLLALYDATGDPSWFTLLQKMLYTEIINDNLYDPVFSFGNVDSTVLDWFGGANSPQKVNKGQKGNGVCDIWQNCEVIEYFLGPYCWKLRKLGAPDLVAELYLQAYLEAIEEYAWATPQNGKFTFSTDWVQDGITFTGGVAAKEKDNVIYGIPFEMMPADELYGDGDYVLKAFHPYLPGAFAWGEILGLPNLAGPTSRQMIQDTLRWFLGPDSITAATAAQYGETPYIYSWKDDVYDTKNAALAKESATKLSLVAKGLYALQRP